MDARGEAAPVRRQGRVRQGPRRKLIPATIGLRGHAAALIGLAAPLAVSQLAFVAMGVTDTVLLGSLGQDALAAGGLATQLAITVGVMLQAVLQSVSVLVAQARGGGRPVGGIAMSGLVLALLLTPLYFAWQSAVPSVLRAIGEPERLVQDVGRYLDVLRWGSPGSVIGIGLMRALLPALGGVRVILYVSVVAAVANGLLNYGLIHGVGPLPALGFLGSALATSITITLMAVALSAFCVFGPVRAALRGGRADWATLVALARLGLPVGATVGVETSVFLTIGLLMGLIGEAALAAHQIALNIAVICFMVPLSLSQAANVRVGFLVGASDAAEARRAGFTAIGLGGLFMAVAGIVLATIPGAIVGLYVSGHGEVVTTALSLVAIAAVFQVVDGVQTVAAGALRGLADTRTPFLIATFGYWVVGFGTALALGFGVGLGARGLWWGLAAGLAVVAVLMTVRFAQRSRVV